MVAQDGPAPLSARALVAYHRGRRRQQWSARAAVEMGTATVGQPHALGDHRLSPPARDQQVEQDRAPTLLVHQNQMERPDAREYRGERKFHWHHTHRCPATSQALAVTT